MADADGRVEEDTAGEVCITLEDRSSYQPALVATSGALDRRQASSADTSCGEGEDPPGRGMEEQSDDLSWQMPIDSFLDKRMSMEEIATKPRKIRQFYKHQNELVEGFLQMQEAQVAKFDFEGKEVRREMSHSLRRL